MSIVAFEAVSKYFHRHGGQMLIRDRIRNLFDRQPREQFCALRDVSFAIERRRKPGGNRPEWRRQKYVCSICDTTLPAQRRYCAH